MASKNDAKKGRVAAGSTGEGAARPVSRRDFLRAGYSRAVAALVVGVGVASQLAGCYSDKYSDYYSNYYSKSYSKYYPDGSSYYNYYSNYSNYS